MQTLETLLSKKEKEEKVKAGITTGVITLLILLLLILVGFKTTKEDGDSGGGVEVQMGDPNQGGPDNSPANERTVPVTPQQVESDDYALTNQDGVDVNQQQKPRQTQQTTQTQTPPTPDPPRIETALEKMQREALERSGGQGTGTTPGTQGEPDGTGNSPTGGGTGNDGTGTERSGDDPFKLGGFGNRKIRYAPEINSKCPSGKGWILFEVEVAPNGSVVRVLNENAPTGTAAAYPCLVKEAADLVKKVRLSSISGSSNTFGKITVTIRN